MIINGNSIEELKKFPDNYFHSVVTDPPYGLVSITKRFGKVNSAPAKFGSDGVFQRKAKGFMGKEWDGSGIEYNIELWQEVFRVLKEGGYLLAFGGTRTHHKLATSIEDAGFEIRDMIAWVYGSGFPKSHNIGKAVDKLQGNEREFIGENIHSANRKGKYEGWNLGNEGKRYDTKGYSEWEGWGTALKPALEPITMARKPFKTTVAENVLKNGVGGINIDGCRVKYQSKDDMEIRKNLHREKNIIDGKVFGGNKYSQPVEQGRFPANFIHDGSDEVTDLFPDVKGGRNKTQATSIFGAKTKDRIQIKRECDDGSASRFFYCAKASKKDRNEGLEDKENIGALSNAGKNTLQDRWKGNPRKNNHPTVKPTDLMRYLVRLVTPKNGIVLDCFMGSGSTGKACALEGFEFVGIDLDKDYCEIAKARIDKAIEDKKQADLQTKLF